MLTTDHKPLITAFMSLTFEQALQTIRDRISETTASLTTEILPLEAARGRVLAENARADRDYPPFHRATRDGFAVASAGLSTGSAVLDRIGEVAAGGHFDGTVPFGACVSIMTGAPLPDGTDAVVMLEEVEIEGTHIKIPRPVKVFENVVRKGSEAVKESIVLRHGRRLGSGELGLLASLGISRVKVFRQPRISILSTGDELVEVDDRPEWFQVRNSNAMSLAAQAVEAGGIPRIIGIAPDRLEALQEIIRQGLKDDLLVISGGVSAGKYDFVEQALAGLGAEFYFESVAIRPGRPVVFGRVNGRFFFGLPGNPASSYVTFEVFARRAIGMLSGAGFEDPVFLGARLGKSITPKAGLTTFMPARVEMSAGEPVVNLVAWQGSGDQVGVASANCFLMIRPDQKNTQVGDWALVMLKN